MTSKLLLGGFGLVAILALAACGGGGGRDIYPPNPPGMVKIEDQVGGASGFGALFRANANTDPAEPNANSVPALSLTTDPVAVP